MSGDGLGYNDEQQAVETEWFDYDAIEHKVFGIQPPETEEEYLAARLAITALQEVLRWGFQNGMNNPNGLIIRYKILCWNLLPEVQASYNLTELAGEDEKAKQSFGRWQDEFKARFPNVPNIHKRP